MTEIPIPNDLADLTDDVKARLQQHRERYTAAAHAVQSGIAAEMRFDPTLTEPKHMRVGIAAALSGQAGLVELLIRKGLITQEEYFKAVADAMETEKATFEHLLSERFGQPVELH